MVTESLLRSRSQVGSSSLTGPGVKNPYSDTISQTELSTLWGKEGQEATEVPVMMLSVRLADFNTQP